MTRSQKKPGKCDACGSPLRTYVTATGLALTEYAAACPKCKTVYKRPVCFGRATLETQTDLKIVTTILKKITAAAVVKEATVTETIEK